MFVLTLLSTMAFQTMPRIEMGMPRRIRFFISNVMNRGPGLQQIGNKMSRVGICSHQEDYVLEKSVIDFAGNIENIVLFLSKES
jgi:hypothetical protein